MVQSGVIIERERRRRFTEDQKFELLSAAFGAGGNVAEVARRAEICTSLLYRWRQAHLAAKTPAFVPAVLSNKNEQTGSSRPSAEAAIVVELAPGITVRIGASAQAALVEATLRVLR